jgi:hypothetical protein
MGVDLVRTHDIDCKGTGDIDGIGENRIFRDWSANPDDPASYNFGPQTGRSEHRARRARGGLQPRPQRPQLRGARLQQHAAARPGKYAAVARRVAQHYNDGWAHGYHLGIRYWEIWNEPDLIPFWTGTLRRSSTPSTTARDLARARAPAPVMQWAARRSTTNKRPHGYRESLLDLHPRQPPAARLLVVPPLRDFSNDPLNFTRISRGLPQVCVGGGGGTRLPAAPRGISLTEWN